MGIYRQKEVLDDEPTPRVDLRCVDP